MHLPSAHDPDRLLSDEIHAHDLQTESRFCWISIAVIASAYSATLPWMPRPRTSFLIATGIALASAAGYFTWVSRHLQRGLIWKPLRYLNLLVLVSLVTTLAAIDTWSFSALHAMTSLTPLLYGFVIVFAALSMDPWLCIWAGALSAAQFLALYRFWIAPQVSRQILEQMPSLAFPAAVLRSGVFLATGAAAGFAAGRGGRLLGRFFHIVQDRDRTRSVFGRPVTPEAERAVFETDPQLSGHSRTATVAWVILHDFHPGPGEKEALGAFQGLRQWSQAALRIIEAEGGTVNRLLADGMLATFGAPVPLPADAFPAARAALRIRDEIRSALPPGVGISIGLSRGLLVGGNTGTQDRWTYTLAGPAVEAAAAMERMNATYGTEILADSTVLASAGEQLLTASPDDAHKDIFELVGIRPTFESKAPA